ncbi:MAG TPA: vWA domain-containing protein [Phenylobacterium sp.]
MRSSGLRRFLLDKRGNVALVTALSLGPICLAGLGAADLARATSAKVQLQDAIDAAALAAARTNATTDAQLKVAGDKYLRQNLALGQDFVLTASDFKFGPGGTVQGTARLDVHPFVAGLMNGGTMAVGASSEVVRADMKVEIALVLDNTGSMTEGTKLADMKTAAKNFVTKMEEASNKAVEANSVRISLVPFSNTVRIDGTTYRYSSWIDQTGSSPINDEIFTTASGTQHADRFALFSNLGVTWRGCVEMRKAPYDVQDTAPTSGATLYTPYFAVDEPDSRSSGYGSDYQNDYVDDGEKKSVTNWRIRQGSITKYGGSKKGTMSNTYGPNKGCELQKIIRLSTDFAGLRTAIDNLNAAGNTNIPIGLAWGWNTITPNPPFADGVAYGTAKYKKIIVLMTDGENTMDQRDTPNDGTYAGTGYIWQGRVLKADGSPLPQGASDAERTAALDSRMALLCTNMKNKQIDIYAIGVEVGSSSVTQLKACASGADHFYDVKSSSTLSAAFDSIAGQIAALHLSR